MTTTLLDPDTTDPVAVGVAQMHELLDRLHASAAAAPVAGHARLLADLDRAGRRLEALKLKILAAADRAGAATSAGFTGTDAWAARHTNTSRTTTAREVHLATDLTHGHGHDTTAEALDAGLVSPAHAAVIVHATDHLPTGISDQQRATVEAALVEKAQRFNPDQLRRLARRALETIEPDPQVVDAHENDLVRTEEHTAHDKTRLTLHDNHDGTTTGHFTIPTLAAAILRKTIETITAPRRIRATEQANPDRLHDRLHDWDHRRGLALAELLEHLPTDHLHPKTAATVVVTIDHTALQGALKTAGLDTGDTISAGEARRLACTAGILPAVLGTRSLALDLGRENRLFSEPQRLALALQHPTCAAEHCERPYAWSELHHRQPWSHGGTTNLRDAIPLCHYHHQRIHDPAFTHHQMPNGTIRLSRRT